MNRFIIYTLLILLYACNGNEQNQDSQSSFKHLLSDTTNEIRLITRFNSFDTTVEVLFWDTKDSISTIQKKNYEGFISKQDLLASDILQKIFDYYKKLYNAYLSGAKLAGNNEELEKILPKPTTAEDLKPFITPAIIHIQNKKDCVEGVLGIEFDCTWDIKSGLGVKIENWKVVEVGVSVTSYFF